MNLGHLQKRAELLARLRAFFCERGFLEVETPLLATEVIPERHIGLMPLADGHQWLQASPEMHHKRLLCSGSGPIFEVTRSFRQGEKGAQHSPEFTIVEWYRPGDDMRAGMELLDELLRELLLAPPACQTSYHDAFESNLGVNPHSASVEELQKVAASQNISPPAEMGDRDDWLNLLLAKSIEPTLGRESPELLYHYPATQAALASMDTDEQGNSVAERFELYWRGFELANGYHELTDPAELQKRLELANEQRVADGNPGLPMPRRLLADMADSGLPACAGVALGFDRLVMLAAEVSDINEVRPFS